MTGADLRARRQALSLTQAQLAAHLGEQQPNVSAWERGTVRITPMRAEWLDRRLRELEAATVR